MKWIRTIFTIALLVLAAGDCAKKSNPVAPPFEGDFPPATKFSVTLYSTVQTVAVGDTVRIKVVLYNVTNVSGAAIDMTYSTSTVDVLGVQSGTSFFPPDSVISLSRIEPDSSRVGYGVSYRNAASGVSKSGSGVICVLTCRAKASGTASFVINSNTLEIKTPNGAFIDNFANLVIENLSIAIR